MSRAGARAALAAAIAVALVAGRAAARPPVAYRIDPAASRFDVKTGTAGLLGGLAHDHLIRAKDPRGRVVYDPADPGASSVEVEVDATTLLVKDEGIDEDDRKEIEETLKGEEVLHVEKHPTIRFRSTKVEGTPPRLRVRGELTLHGTTRAIEVPVEITIEEGGAAIRARGTFEARTSDYGMKPYSAALGTIRVADRVEFDFEAVGRR